MTDNKQVTPTDLKPIKTKHIAAKYGIKPTQLRRILRDMPDYADGVHTNYAWAEGDKTAFAKIDAAVKAVDAKRAKAKLDAQARLKAKQAEQQAAAKQDAKVA